MGHIILLGYFILQIMIPENHISVKYSSLSVLKLFKHFFFQKRGNSIVFLKS